MKKKKWVSVEETKLTMGFDLSCGFDEKSTIVVDMELKKQGVKMKSL
jgi:hypothetical protein